MSYSGWRDEPDIRHLNNIFPCQDDESATSDVVKSLQETSSLLAKQVHYCQKTVRRFYIGRGNGTVSISGIRCTLYSEAMLSLLFDHFWPRRHTITTIVVATRENLLREPRISELETVPWNTHAKTVNSSFIGKINKCIQINRLALKICRNKRQHLKGRRQRGIQTFKDVLWIRSVFIMIRKTE